MDHEFSTPHYLTDDPALAAEIDALLPRVRAIPTFEDARNAAVVDRGIDAVVADGLVGASNIKRATAVKNWNIPGGHRLDLINRSDANIPASLAMDAPHFYVVSNLSHRIINYHVDFKLHWLHRLFEKDLYTAAETIGGDFVWYSVRGVAHRDTPNASSYWSISRKFIPGRPLKTINETLTLYPWPLLISDRKSAQALAALAHSDTTSKSPLIWRPVDTPTDPT